MTYAGSLEIYDADSHIMELPDFLTNYLEGGLQDRFGTIDLAQMPPMRESIDEIVARGHKHSPEHVAEILELGDGLLRGPRNYDSVGAFNSHERGQVMDILGFKKQLVFGSIGALPALMPGEDIDAQYGIAHAFNLALSDFVRGDARLMGVGVVPLDDPARAIRELDFLLRQPGLTSVMVPHRHCGGRSPGHDEYDPFWARLEEARVPFTLHVGGDLIQVDSVWMNTGRPTPTDWFGGAENVRGKDIIVLNHAPELFLAAMIMDGVFERFPRLTGAVVELGAGWVPAFVTKMDWAVHNWKKTEPELAKLSREPSEIISSQLAFTPFVFEDVGALMRQSNPELYLFSSDYPHAEGGRNPIGRFSETLKEVSDPDRQKFYSENFKRVFPLAAA